ncbi:HNH endonuclease domain-containing protein [Coleofasciculus sp. E1-EBD-02]|uniref:HNH endonuclease domain-containing protein n=1 Tax=Coleofasciculus sp. E1-EBD-02 TaxID=3068481 RepID=UPI004062E355
MGKAGQALKQVLTSYDISQSQLATELGVERPIVFRWFHEQTDPTAETVAEIVRAIQIIDPEASREFVEIYLGHLTTNAPTNLIRLDSGQLPESDQVDVVALSRLFSNITTSYKYLFFLSLLDILKRRQFEVLSSISFKEIIVEMLANAWYPHTYFKLSFGTQDKIAQKLDSLTLEITASILKFTDTNKKLLRTTIAFQDLSDSINYLKRYVPFRLIAPFLDAELKAAKVSKGRGNDLEKAIPAIADHYFDSQKPLYKFDQTDYNHCESIFIHPDWATYLEKHYAIIRGWASWEWVKYMQQRNPNTPNIVSKIFMPQQRGSLSSQTKYWKQVLAVQPVSCIYSGQLLDQENLSLDHYLPWSFVAHDQLWNLIPTHPSVNASKSNNLPSVTYFNDFVELQYLGLTASYQVLSHQKWLKAVESHISELKMSDAEDLLDIEKLRKAYELTIHPLMSLATIQGFSPDWSYH